MSIERELIRLHKFAKALQDLSSDNICSEPGCNKPLSKPGHKYCYDHWKKHNQASSSQSSSNFEPSLLSATQISQKLSIPKNRVNAILAEIGLLSKQENGWVATKLGMNFGAVERIHPKDKTKYVLWPTSVLDNQAFLRTIDNIQGNNLEENQPKTNQCQSFREQFRTDANYRTTDGHWVRSKAEMLIDNWLYMSGLVHAYERRLPIEEELYCDFYLPGGKVYIEYWGYENNAEYLERKKVKQNIYHKYDFNLIELSDDQIKNIDDYLPRVLLQFGVVVN
ncbi:conserved hypothetical protein [Gloeothece citriformis PCC 7424]|uniref:Uncharacterized protein n=1 Tax=Gloeothece citriformis (strain PCC 7424) TaxID=65393 RepID=B7KIV2_GLOC7|nr:hypothetical protein [Gloeothece citriformis]ACK70788.1 conserved hypothetical protein [Gloeothece citriformis PCC 7424]